MDAFKNAVFEWYARGENRRTLPIAKYERAASDWPEAWLKLGKFIGESIDNGFCKGMIGDTDKEVPAMVFRIEKRQVQNSKGKEQTKCIAALKDVFFDRGAGIDLTKANSAYRGERNFGIIGYDTEFLSDEKLMLSHQFCFDAGPGWRFGVVLDTDIRFTDSGFIAFIGNIVKHSNLCIDHKRWICFAHFSLAEGSWIDSSGRDIIERKKKKWQGKVVLTKRLKYTDSGKISRTKKKGKMVDRTENIYLEFADTMDYGSMSLKKTAETCELEKLAPIPLEFKDCHWFKRECDAVYKQFNVIRDQCPDEFYRYGFRDAVITAGIPIVLHSIFGTEYDFQKRSAKYSEEYIAEWLKKTYAGGTGGWQSMLGQRKLEYPGKNGTPNTIWEPDRLQRDILQNWYKGGRNEAREVGYFEGSIHYYDMKSAYPASVAALRSDFNFSLVTVRTRSDGAEERIKQLWNKGPFQPHGIKAYVKFKDDCKVPMAPISVYNGIIYPMETEGEVICWPEYWTAIELGIIAESHILSFYEFEELKTRAFPDHILEMLKLRDEAPVFYKSILNYMTGKFVQGRNRSKDIPFSKICSPVLGAYATSTTRAAAAEYANTNQYYAITTDGIISPESELVQPKGGINERLSDRLADIGWEWMKREFTGDKAAVWKTRGYMIYNSKVAKTAPVTERFKQARMGLQGEAPEDILQQVKDGVGKKRSAKTFKELEFGEVFSFIEKETKVNPNYDFKYAIIRDSIKEKTLEMDDVTINNMPCFKTRPLRNVNEYYDLRRISERMIYWKLSNTEKKTFSSKDLDMLMLTGLLQDRRCMHMQWEFRKRMARFVHHIETTKNVHTLRSWKEKPLYKIPAKFGMIEDFMPILETEAKIIKDEERRQEVLELVIGNMKADIEYRKDD